MDFKRLTNFRDVFCGPNNNFLNQNFQKKNRRADKSKDLISFLNKISESKLNCLIGGVHTENYGVFFFLNIFLKHIRNFLKAIGKVIIDVAFSQFSLSKNVFSLHCTV